MQGMQALLHKCKEKGVINPTQQTIQAMTTKVGAISDSASSIFTLIRSQMPYPYVHLVSFTVHFYLFFWATYMGALLNSGIPDGSVTQSGPTSPFDVTTDGVSADDAWVRPCWMYWSSNSSPWKNNCAPPPRPPRMTGLVGSGFCIV